MPATPRQRRYDQVMGDCEPKVTDKKFVQELLIRLEAKYAESQAAKENQLAECEKKRVRKLILEGLLESEDRRKGKTDEKADKWAEYWPPNPNKTLQQYEEERRRAEEEKQKEEQAAAEEERKRLEEEEKQALEQQQQEQQQQEDQEAANHEEPQGKYTQSVPDCIRQLLEEDDLDKLYQLAKDLVHITAPIKAKAK